tara:strand:+ start:268 stop:486 length:219 start_codon:yes stop_codon:yes gene_type:complete
MWRYTHGDKVYDVEKISPEGQATFMLIADVQKRIEDIETNLTINQAAVVALHQKLQELLVDEAIVEEDETEE